MLCPATQQRCAQLGWAWQGPARLRSHRYRSARLTQLDTARLGWLASTWHGAAPEDRCDAEWRQLTREWRIWNRAKCGNERSAARASDGGASDAALREWSTRFQIRHSTQWEPGKNREDPGRPGKTRETPGKPGKPRETPGNPGKTRENPGNPGKTRENPGRPGKTREDPGRPGKTREDPG
eukprot:gene15715-biopygen10550